MPDMTFAPPLTPVDRLGTQLATQGYAVLGASDLMRLAAVSPDALRALAADWSDLPPDRYLRDGGRYRRRRHASFVVEGDAVTRTPHRAHWQPLEYNALHGGIERWFEPIAESTSAQSAWLALLRWLARVADALKASADAPQRWYVEAHQFRIDTTDGIGRPTPEGAHRDGVELVAVFLVAREGIKGGETRVFEATGPAGQRFTLTEPWSVLLLDDLRVIHETTPIQPLAIGGHRDTLVVTLRRGGFQDPEPS
jgi:hypothetical protein